MLFDEFWREGELALFFGAAGSGKSVLAVQLADALSRGGGLLGFRGPQGRRRVLYVDLRHTDEQFLMRCMRNADTFVRDSPATGRSSRSLNIQRSSRTKAAAFHRFPKNLLRDRPLPGRDLCEWLRAYVVENHVQAVIVDDLSAVKNTHDGTRETLGLIRRFRSLRDELRISILVLAESSVPPRGRPVSEADLGRSRVLCTAADSVFAAGRGRACGGDHYLVQTRARSSRIYWTWRNSPVAHVTRTETGLLSFEFDERFGEKMDKEKRRLICEVSRLHEVEFKTFREIARQLGISKTWACELYRKWTPAMESQLEEEGRNAGRREYAPSNEAWIDEDEQPDGSETPEDKDVWPDEPAGNTTGRECVLSNKGTQADSRQFVPIDPSSIPFAAALARRSIYDLTLGHDGYGREIYIETRCEHTSKPAVWYQLDKRGLKRRFTRDSLGIRVEHLDTGPFL
jgi:energy-coupling factor transporter ATP-binding protein EcfA2